MGTYTATYWEDLRCCSPRDTGTQSQAKTNFYTLGPNRPITSASQCSPTGDTLAEVLEHYDIKGASPLKGHWMQCLSLRAGAK